MEKDWVSVYQTGQKFEAEMAREILENESINCVLIDENDSLFPSIGEVEVMVHKDFEVRAKELLKDLIH
ncbi:MAG TPA: DUF2007 domain-containing protein [Prolixibacteraceae bacterium]|nr:DUF2007 domain-containing protein [Prolixibacteraceae bacterium]